MELLTMLMESHTILSEIGKTVSDYVDYMESSYKETLDYETDWHFRTKRNKNRFSGNLV